MNFVRWLEFLDIVRTERLAQIMEVRGKLLAHPGVPEPGAYRAAVFFRPATSGRHQRSPTALHHGLRRGSAFAANLQRILAQPPRIDGFMDAMPGPVQFTVTYWPASQTCRRC